MEIVNVLDANGCATCGNFIPPEEVLNHQSVRGDVQRFRKKPVEIEAVRWTGDNLREVINFTGLHPSAEKWTWEEYETVIVGNLEVNN